MPAFLQPLGRLVRKGTILAYGEPWLAAGLYLSAAGGWVGAAWLALRGLTRRARARWALLAFVTGWR